ncbi:uncharacterized protein ColSpa_09990 [Colletotrichum spaethianum]|uniref:Uncharacterized protein n=1 Tax=Colletotrichum spaethianum TaxID=700344 RepID=A0AA37PCR7_9PEZI|nr:uncharacterized protein ColSpa_09990 [Colletotrichum spaethianum]GKT49809.1 hypothetical protein ColSpa_09990 [Colletotrichum spaethianum]
MDYEKGKAFEAASYAPPEYLDNHQDVPASETPMFNHMTTNTRTLVAATARFPPTFNCYAQWKWKQVYSLGPSSDEKMFTISFDNKLFSKKQSLFLHSGPSNKAPIIATASRKALGWHDRATVTLHRENGDEQEISFERPEDASWTKSEVRAFRIELRKGVVEEFQWRTSHGDEIKELAGHSYGWKLVRMANPQRGQQSFGYTSDGQEVVAVLAHNMSWSVTKGYNFGFLGTGLTGTLGEEWETAAVISGFWLWHLSVTRAIANSSSASAAAGAAAAAS